MLKLTQLFNTHTEYIQTIYGRTQQMLDQFLNQITIPVLSQPVQFIFTTVLTFDAMQPMH